MIAHDMVASHRDLPLRLYELTHFSFRREQGGEVAGLRRLRSFTMPDMHSLVRDMDMAKSEFVAQVALCLRWLADIGLECVPAIRFVRSWWDEHPAFIADLMAAIGRPALVEVWDERFFYFVAKFEMNQAMRVARGEKARWPVWLAPTQVRLTPVSATHVDGAMRLAKSLPFRVDVDDRDIKLGKKIHDAEREWIPYVVVVGDQRTGRRPLDRKTPPRHPDDNEPRRCRVLAGHGNSEQTPATAEHPDGPVEAPDLRRLTPPAKKTQQFGGGFPAHG